MDGQYVVVDFDKEDTKGLKDSLPPTWRQRTKRGEHFLYRVPAGHRGKNARFSAGDLKVRGYIVGPGSTVAGYTYDLVDSREPACAPDWLLRATDALVSEASGAALDRHLSVNGDSPSSTLIESDSISQGERNLFLLSVGGLLRRRGLGEAGIAKGLSALNKTVLDSPLALSEIRTIAKSVSRYEADTVIGPLHPDGWISAADISIVGPPTRWWARMFVPKAELVMGWGKGGAGKSTFGSWLAAEVTQKGGRFAFAGVEEPFTRFAARAILGNAVPDLLLKVPQASGLSLPRDAVRLAEVLEITQTDVLYFDSIYAHFEVVPGQNSAERARRCLSPLAEMAQETGKTVVCMFHENKAGMLLGSLEMENVARVSLHFRRQEGKPLLVMVDKTNLRRPEYHMSFTGQEMALSDPGTGEVQMEEQEDGSLAAETIFVARRDRDVPRESVSVDDIKVPLEVEIEAALRENPDLSNSLLAEVIGVSKSSVDHKARGVREALGLSI